MATSYFSQQYRAATGSLAGKSLEGGFEFCLLKSDVLGGERLGWTTRCVQGLGTVNGGQTPGMATRQHLLPKISRRRYGLLYRLYALDMRPRTASLSIRELNGS